MSRSGSPRRPPRLAERFLARVLRTDPAAPAILGDLHEDFVRRCRRQGVSAARLWYWREVLGLALGRTCHTLLTPSRSRPMHDVLLGGLPRDAAYALRSLRRNPGFGLFTAAVIGLGVGAATAVFSVLQPLVLAPLPFPEAEDLVWIANESEPGDRSLSAITSRSSNLRDFRERASSFDGLTGFSQFFRQSAYTLGGGEPERLVGVDVAHDFLDVLGVVPLHGRSFTVQEGQWDGPAAVVLTHGFWQRRFRGDPEIVGRALTLNDEPRTVVGVLPPSFDFASFFAPGADVDFLLPFPISPETARWGNMLSMVGRLRPGATPESAQAELDAIVTALREEQPDRWGLGARVTPLQAHIAGPFRPALLLLAAAAGTLLLIVCVNVANLLLARSPGRAREVAVRKALGASRGRIVRQLVLETMGVALAGGVVGGVLAWGAVRLVSGTAGIEVPLLHEVRVDGAALGFATAVAMLSGLLVGLLPALSVADGGEAQVLRSAAPGSGGSRGGRRLRETLVVAEVSLACVLLVVGGLLVRSFRAVLDVDLGFEAADVVAWQLNPGRDFESFREATDFYAALTERVEQVPGVERAGLIDALPLGRNRTWGFSIPGVPDEKDTDDEFYPHIVDPGYLPTLRIPLVAGRNFTRDDTGETPPVVMMNEAGAQHVFGDAPLGRRIQLWDEREWEVVGVVRDLRHVSPESGPGIQIYFPIAQMGDFPTLDLAVRSGLAVDEVTAAVASALREMDPSMPTREWWTVQSTVDQAVSARTFTLRILTAYGVAALFLAGLGIYGVLAQSVAQRKAEIGIRRALGASSSGIVGRMLGRTLLLTAWGIALGGLLSLAGGRLLDSLLFGVTATDPVTYGGMALTLLLVAAAAGALPAARAARVQGVGVLRGE